MQLLKKGYIFDLQRLDWEGLMMPRSTALISGFSIEYYEFKQRENGPWALAFDRSNPVQLPLANPGGQAAFPDTIRLFKPRQKGLKEVDSEAKTQRQAKNLILGVRRARSVSARPRPSRVKVSQTRRRSVTDSGGL